MTEMGSGNRFIIVAERVSAAVSFYLPYLCHADRFERDYLARP